ncbi:hypothetical protein K458DRAFT_286022 [Lentithecium fluviatile CBS 122367]|uniref:Uncharacterized protein n=1 Tax=Lentithecium fluviatile CBS 122367 TaxID=1168545 RepID=A0A6G1JPM7_9PLEO|nr:hypothetical protein K458DRAFT_286022 [Lentithecium fluviatile CBS 122367]
MYPRPHLRGIPRELRDEILKAYVKVEGGYTYIFRSGKLTAKGQPVDLALTFTYRLISEEMRGLALGLNSIIFSTV